MRADFGTGRRLPDEITPAKAHPGVDKQAMDFVALFPLTAHRCEDEESEECGWQLTPRTADVLHTALSRPADSAYEDTEKLNDAPITAEEDEEYEFFGRLTRITRRQNRAWRKQVARACDDLTGDIKNGN
ncbi:hypothetical protein B4N89_27235 [Embleya scabrispora]|uniref:Uncharacterized protein n=1 Tax=Embleya scabrispora TaxID=159449 RepID=A0A1T3P4X0_9ACTN|nr:hypothetical protein [Embleya scabrispora]OPC84126.1 hypothetical protein B4N89_27235 [Embleya scabrispora]